MTRPALPILPRAKVPRCKSCRWWERSNNFRSQDRDWGLCHMFGGRAGARMGGGFIDFSYGHEPLGSDTCDFHNADPSIQGTVPTALHPKHKCEGDFT